MHSYRILPGNPSWFVGDTCGFCLFKPYDTRLSKICTCRFLKNVYTVFRAGDSPAVGFAELADGLNGMSKLHCCPFLERVWR